ncbi:MAG TPA: 2Fe-2S iron-sulfur cluster-binding protein, partial [Pseudonocardia sp.]|nr:2Fe-2S iron-sulfur cluster-binding protein [Pseudonocardia sp.]
PAPSRETIRAEMSGNICRCTGYIGIVDAIQAAATAAAPTSRESGISSG